MNSQLKPIHIWGRGGPNPTKVQMLLEELEVPYETDSMSIKQVKDQEYLAINPNGRVPSIRDPNTGITLWESGAIFEYLVDHYDKDHKLSFEAGTPEFYQAKQWLFFQISGQGPYFGQAAWFKIYHSEKLPSALERYATEVNRVTGVLESHLGQQKEKYAEGDGPWLVGNKISYADIAFIVWSTVIKMVLTPEEYNEENYPLVKEWFARLNARKAIKAVPMERTQ